jgi:hypothetical protein
MEIENLAGGVLFTPQTDAGFVPKTPNGLDNADRYS